MYTIGGPPTSGASVTFTRVSSGVPKSGTGLSPATERALGRILLPVVIRQLPRRFANPLTAAVGLLYLADALLAPPPTAIKFLGPWNKVLTCQAGGSAWLPYSIPPNTCWINQGGTGNDIAIPTTSTSIATVVRHPWAPAPQLIVIDLGEVWTRGVATPIRMPGPGLIPDYEQLVWLTPRQRNQVRVEVPAPLRNPNVRVAPRTRPIEETAPREEPANPAPPHVRRFLQVQARSLTVRQTFEPHHAGPKGTKPVTETQTKQDNGFKPPTKPGRKEKERKIKSIGVTVFRILDSISEKSEVIDSFFDALPKDVQKKWKKKGRPFLDSAGQYGIDGADWKLKALWYNWDKVDLREAIENVITNELSDKLYGSAYKRLPKNLGNAHSDLAKSAGKEINQGANAIWSKINAVLDS